MYAPNLQAVRPVEGFRLEASSPREARAISELKIALKELGKDFETEFTAGGNSAAAILTKRSEIRGLQALVMASTLPAWRKERLSNTLAGLSGQLRRGGGRLAAEGRL